LGSKNSHVFQCQIFAVEFVEEFTHDPKVEVSDSLVLIIFLNSCNWWNLLAYPGQETLTEGKGSVQLTSLY